MREAIGKHPGIETLAEYTEGRLPAHELPALMAHLDECDACMSEIELANDAIRDEAIDLAAPHARWRRTWFAVAAAVVAISALSFVALRQGWLSRSPEAGLVAAVPRSARIVEARLSGGFAWAAYNGTLRAGDTSADPERLRLAGVAAEAIDRGNHDPSASSQHTAGVALVLIDHPLEGVERLRKAANGAPNDAKSWNDLAAGEYAAALSLNHPSLYAQALGDVEHALRLDSRMPEALFNRALILGRMGLTDEERHAWADYLAADGTSEWAVEARKRLLPLPVGGGAGFFDRSRPRLEAAAAAGDAETVRAIVDADRERARTFGEVEYLGRWGESFANGDAAGAAAALSVSRAIGDALVSLSGESLLHDAVHVIDTAADPAALAEAHVVYRHGRIAYSKNNLAVAEGDLRRAAVLFAAAGDPLAFIARYYASSVRFDQHDVSGARYELEAMVEELRGRPQYIDALAQVQWEMGLCRSAVGDWSGALASFTDSTSRFERLGERSNLAVMNAERAWVLDLLGRPEEAWTARIAAFAAESRERRGERLATVLGWTSVAEVRAGHGEAARALLAIEERMHRAAGSDSMLVHTLEWEAEVDTTLGDENAALAAAREARLAASRLSDPALRSRELAVAQLATAVAELRRNPNEARSLLTEAVPVLRASGLGVRVPEAELLRAEASLRLGDREEEGRAIDVGIAALDPLRVPVGAGAVATGIVDAAPALYAEAVRLHLTRGDVAGAFAYAERAHVLQQGAPTGARALQEVLTGSGTAVLEPFVLDSEVVVFALDEREVRVSRHAIARVDLEALVARNADAALYDALIRPSEPMIARARHLIIVPGPELAGVPFAALGDGNHVLVERLPVSIAPSASAIVRVPERARRSVIAAALPVAVAGGLAALPESGSEADDVARLYSHGQVLPHPTLAALRDAATRADVVHIAGHTVRDSSDDAALVLGGERVAWTDIAGQRFGRADTIALAACETLRQPARADVRALSLGAAFLAAGAHYVIGTLTPISDVDARNIFREIHRQLAAGVEPPEAVRRAQLADLAAGRSGWRAVAIMTNQISF